MYEIEKDESNQDKKVAYQMDEISNVDHMIGDETISRLCHESNTREEVGKQ